MKQNYRIWAILHVKGRNPKKCICQDCADRDFCDQSSNPDECAKKALFEFGVG